MCELTVLPFKSSQTPSEGYLCLTNMKALQVVVARNDLVLAFLLFFPFLPSFNHPFFPLYVIP